MAQTVAYEELLTWLLFYTAIFETQNAPMVDIIDPAGVVRSQVIENPIGTLHVDRLGKPPHACRPFHRRDLRLGYSASGLQHRRHFRNGQGAQAERFPAAADFTKNYYDDVEARFGLDPGLSERLKAENILYDRDEHGEFFQLYSGTYGEGFFFEIVDWCGYRGYGAGNAIFRIAALKKQIRPEGMPAIANKPSRKL